MSSAAVLPTGSAPATGPLVLRAEAVGMAVPEGRILRPCTLEVAAGELVALIGPSGSGKTTLLRIIAGVADPSEGRVTLGGVPVTERSTDVGFLPVGETVHPQLTVREALDYAAALRLPGTTAPTERDARVDDVLTELRLTDRADVRVGDLSTGQRKRAACAVELIAQPAMLLLDEPGTGLDPALEARLMTTLRAVADQQRGVAVVTHATSSLSVCDRVAVMAAGGELRFAGTPVEVLRHFDVQAYDEIYTVLAAEEDEGHPAGEEEHEPLPLPRPLRRVRPQATGSYAAQAGVLTGRYARCLTRDGRTLAVLLAQAPVIALAIGIVLPRDVLGQLGIASFYAVLLSFLLVTGSIWLGVTSACREIVKERSIVTRELAAGVRLEAYVTAKVLVLFALAVVQVLLLVLFAVILQPLHQGFPAYVQVATICTLVAWASVAMGLTLSAFARSSDQASSAVPLLLIPQLLFAGAIVPTGLMPSPVRVLSELTYARWAQAGLGNALELDQKLSEQVTSVAGYERSFFDLPPASAAIALALFTFVLIGAATLALDRRAVS